MSRGLGEQQRKMLRAIARAHDDHPTWFGIQLSLVLNNFCFADNRLPERVDQLHERQKREADRAKHDWAEYRATVKAAAAAGEPAAIARQRDLELADVLGAAIRGWRKSVQSQCCGRHQERNLPDVDPLLNPSRIIGALVKRGLVERVRSMRGAVRLTPAGRACLINPSNLEAMLTASATLEPATAA
jgi:hypothetical protein